MKYFAMIDGARRGPAEIETLVNDGLRPDTYVWCKGMADWQQAREVADICRFFRRRLHDRMHPQVAPVETLPAAPEKASGGFAQLREISSQIISTPPADETAAPPSPCPAWLVILAFIGCLPLGIVALISNRQMHRAWEQHKNEVAHAAARRAKMAGGIGACLILIILAAFIR